jgi:DNA invertase Pin-like site-specific DNA recombinase
MTTALIYIRQSRHKDYERSVSPEVQEASCRALPAVQRCDQVDVFTDLDVSGGKRARRGYDAMLARIRAGGADVVAAYDQSRAFRSTLIAAEFKALLEERGHAAIEVLFVHGSFDRSPVGGFSFAVLAAAHQMERQMTGEKIREAKAFAASRGEMVGAMPLGLRWDGAGRDRRVVVDEEWAPVVPRIFDEYATARYSTRAIAARLNADGIRPSTFKTGWRADTVAQLLGNIAYIGRTYSERRSKRQGELIRASWPALVGDETWSTVDRLLSRYHRKGGRQHQHDGQEGVYAFQGLLRCAQCGERLQAHRLWKRRARTQHTWSLTYYRCRGAAVSGHADCGRGVRDDRVVAWGRELMEFLESRSDQREAVAEALAAAADAPPYRSPAAADHIDAQLARVGQRFEWGDITAEDYRQKREWLISQRDEVSSVEPKPPNVRLSGLLDAWDRSDALGRRELLAALFVELDVKDGQVWRCRPQPEIAAELWAYLKDWKGAPLSSQTDVLDVAPAGFEPAISALRGLRPSPLDDGAKCWWAALGSNQ